MARTPPEVGKKVFADSIDAFGGATATFWASPKRVSLKQLFRLRVYLIGLVIKVLIFD